MACHFSVSVFTFLTFGCYILCDTTVVNDSCYIEDKNGNSTAAWRLVWEDGFDGANLSTTDWEIQHEAVFCGGNGIQQVSCNVLGNVHQISGTLSLWAQREAYYEYLYTAATVTTRHAFTYGRWEFRAALPAGKQLRTTIFTRNDNESYWHEFGQIDVMSNTADPVLFRGVHYANSSTAYHPVDLIPEVPMEQLQKRFHLYGVEWDQAEVRFFLDDKYSKRIKLDGATKSLFPHHNIRIQIGVGGRLFTKPMPLHFALLNWSCPAFIIDYVRIYERVLGENVPANRQCADISLPENRTEKVLNDVCERAMRLMVKEIEDVGLVELGKSNWLPILIIALLLLFLFLLTYLIYQIVAVKRRVAQSPSGPVDPMAHYESANEYYENVYDEYNAALDSGDPGNKLSYVQLQEAGGGGPYRGTNEYLEINDAEMARKSLALHQNAYKNCPPAIEHYEDPDAIGDYETLAQQRSETKL